MIGIDFQGGAHGNYLEFVCNKILGLTQGTPFNSLGASHNKTYIDKKVFKANHYSYRPQYASELTNIQKVISIQMEIDDLLPLQQISLLRAGDHGYDNELLEIDTYNKLNNIHYRWVLEEIINGFFKNQIKQSYDAVKDSSWPNVTTIQEFKTLPDHIKKECIEQHKLILRELSPTQPNCPREVLREFFQIGFQHPNLNGFVVRQNKVKYSKDKEVYIFPFKCFYQKNDFFEQIENVATWAKIQYNCQQDIAQLHDEFLTRQPYQKSVTKCNEIVNQIQNNTQTHMPVVDLLEEAYINAKLGWNYFV